MRVLVIGLGPYYFLPSAAESGSSRAERLFIQAAAAHFPGETRPRKPIPEGGFGGCWFCTSLAGCKMQEAWRDENECVYVYNTLCSRRYWSEHVSSLQSCGGTSHFNFLSRPPKILYTVQTDATRSVLTEWEEMRLSPCLYEKLRTPLPVPARKSSNLHCAHSHNNSFSWGTMTRPNGPPSRRSWELLCSLHCDYFKWARITVFPQQA